MFINVPEDVNVVAVGIRRGGEDIARAFHEGASRLYELDLSHNRTSSRGMDAILEGLLPPKQVPLPPSSKQRRARHLAASRLSMNTSASLLDLAPQYPPIQRLALQNIRLGPKGLTALSSFLVRC